MDTWEYRTLYLQLKEVRDSRGKKSLDWVVEFSDGPRVEGWDTILNREGSRGWELVSVVAVYSEGVEKRSVTACRVVFKRKVQDAAS